MSILANIAEKYFKASQNPDQSKELPPIQSANDQSLEEIKLVEHIRSKIDQVRQSNSRMSLESTYLTNIAYLLGYDGVSYDTKLRQFKNADPKRKLNNSRFKVNKVLPTVQNRLARITQSPPRYDVRPNSNSTEDKDAARLGLEIIESVFEKEHFNEKRQDLHMATMQGGVAYVQTLWDPTRGKPMYDPMTEEFTGYEGDVRLEVLNCLEVFKDPLAKTLEESAWIIKAKVRKLEYFKNQYERGDAVKEEDAWLLSSMNDLKSNAMTANGAAGTQTDNQMKNSAIELVYYEKRSKNYPNGRMIVCANGILLEDKELPIGEYDIVKFDDIIVGGRYDSEAVITHLRPIQDQYNVIRTRMANWVKAHLGGKYLAPKGAALGQEAINNGDTEVVEYVPVPNAAPPTAMNIPQIPAYAYKDLETLDKELDYISGINEISRGVLPSASIPASGMAFLQEQDQTRIGVQTTRNEIGYAKVGSNILKYVGRYYEMPRLLKTAGDGLEYTVKEFVGKDIKDNFDVIVIEGSTIPQSKVLRRQDIFNAYQSGILGDPHDPKLRAKIAKVSEFGDVAELWKTQALNEARVKQVISAIEAGDLARLQGLLSEFDNQSLHLVEMNDYRLSDKFQELDPDRQGLFMWVMEWRLQALVNITNPQIPQQQIMAQTMVNNMEKMIAQGGGMPGSPGNKLQVGIDAGGNPMAPQQPQGPMPQQMPQPGQAPAQQEQIQQLQPAM